MPNYDGTGPLGLGPMTGRKLGRCVAGWNSGKRAIQPPSGETGNKTIYGLGRGGRPYGGARGNCFGGRNCRRGIGGGRGFGR